MMLPPARTFKLLVTAMVMLIAAVPVYHAQGETCFSRQHQKAIVNSRVALANPETAMDTRVVQSERDCVLACCSEEVKPGAKCNMAVFKSNKPTNIENCYLFHCDKEQDCPLMVAPDGINTYDIFKGVIHPTTVRPTSTTTEPTTTTTTTEAPTAATTTPPPAPPTTTLTESTTATATGTMAPITQPTTTATTTPATTKATTTTQTSTSLQTTTTAALTQAPTTTQATSTPTQPRKIATTTQARPLIVIATLPAAMAAPNSTPTATAIQHQPPWLASDSRPTAALAPKATSPSTTATPATKKPNKTTKKINKTTKKVKAHSVTTTTTTTTTTIASQSAHHTNAPPAVAPGRKAGRRTTPKPEPATTPTTPTTTTTTATTTASTTTATTATTATATARTTADAEPYIPRTTIVPGLVEAEGGIQPDHTLQNAVSVESVDQGSAVTQGALRSSLVALMVLGLALLALALAAGGRKAMESFDRRHYTRLELNDLHYEV